MVGAARALYLDEGPEGGGGGSGRGGGGIRPFFVGLAPRSTWAACVIAGQFLLYDVFRGMAGVRPLDLNEVLDVLGTVEVGSA